MAFYQKALLGDDDLAELTGYAANQVRRQIKWLDDQRVPYTLRRDGRPRTTWGAYESAMKLETPGSAEPNFAVLYKT